MNVITKGDKVSPTTTIDTDKLIGTGNADDKWFWEGVVTPDTVGTAVRVTKDWVSFVTEAGQTVTLSKIFVKAAA